MRYDNSLDDYCDTFASEALAHGGNAEEVVPRYYRRSIGFVPLDANQNQKVIRIAYGHGHQVDTFKSDRTKDEYVSDSAKYQASCLVFSVMSNHKTYV